MKRLLLFTMSFLLLGGISLAQIAPSHNNYLIDAKKIQPQKVDLSSKVIFGDTILYIWTKYVGNSGFIVNNSGTTVIATGQYFTCPQTVNVEGFNFYADADGAATVTVTCQLYAAGALFLPTGGPLATTTVIVDSIDANGFEVRAMFPTPYSISVPYCIVVTNNSPTDLIMISTANGDGGGSDMASGMFGPTWYSTFSLGGYDIDWIIEPIVHYDIADVTFTKDKVCINNNETVAFDMTAPAIYNDTMYNYYARVDSTKYQFQWNFGDASPPVFAMDTNHTYVIAAPYTITLADTYIGWFYYIVRDTVDQIDLCTDIEEVDKGAISIYPNPVNQTLHVNNVESSTVEIINILGTVVQRIDHAMKNTRFDMSALTEGTYFIRISNDDEVTTRVINVIR